MRAGRDGKDKFTDIDLALPKRCPAILKARSRGEADGHVTRMSIQLSETIHGIILLTQPRHPGGSDETGSVPVIRRSYWLAATTDRVHEAVFRQA